jgi:hypothetical protein
MKAGRGPPPAAEVDRAEIPLDPARPVDVRDH